MVDVGILCPGASMMAIHWIGFYATGSEAFCSVLEGSMVLTMVDSGFILQSSAPYPPSRNVGMYLHPLNWCFSSCKVRAI
jgi:hypothetical protein